MRLLFLLDSIISCFLKNNKFEDIILLKKKKEILINPPKNWGEDIQYLFVIYIIILDLKKVNITSSKDIVSAWLYINISIDYNLIIHAISPF